MKRFIYAIPLLALALLLLVKPSWGWIELWELNPLAQQMEPQYDIKLNGKSIVGLDTLTPQVVYVTTTTGDSVIIYTGADSPKIVFSTNGTSRDSIYHDGTDINISNVLRTGSHFYSGGGLYPSGSLIFYPYAPVVISHGRDYPLYLYGNVGQGYTVGLGYPDSTKGVVDSMGWRTKATGGVASADTVKAKYLLPASGAKVTLGVVTDSIWHGGTTGWYSLGNIIYGVTSLSFGAKAGYINIQPSTGAEYAGHVFIQAGAATKQVVIGSGDTTDASGGWHINTRTLRGTTSGSLFSADTVKATKGLSVGSGTMVTGIYTGNATGWTLENTIDTNVVSGATAASRISLTFRAATATLTAPLCGRTVVDTLFISCAAADTSAVRQGSVDYLIFK